MMTLTKFGMREWLGSGVAAVFLIAGVLTLFRFSFMNMDTTIALCAVFVVAWFCIAAFFRNPSRKIPSAQEMIVSPADGVVRDIELIKNESCGCEVFATLFDGKDMLRIGILSSIFDVHLNRTPVSMKIAFRQDQKEIFHDVRDSRSGKENEAMILGGISKAAGVIFPVAVKQLSSAPAQRIVCPVEPEMELEKGICYGMIQWGSRTELYLPADQGFEINVKVGDRVFGGTTVMATILPVAKKKNFTGSLSLADVK